MENTFITNPVHLGSKAAVDASEAGSGGKITCHKCGAFIKEGETIVEHYEVIFHPFCFNRYEHYYGLDKPID